MRLQAGRSVVVLVAALLLAAAHGQRAFAQSIQAGVVAGANISTLVGDDAPDADSRTAIMAGVQLLFQPATPVGFQTGLIYAGKGAKFSEGGFEGFFKFSYIEIPALLRASFPVTGSQLRPVVLAGLSLGIKSGCTAGIENATTSFEADCDEGGVDGDLDMKSIDLGMSLGFGLDVPVGNGLILSPAARYTRGLTSLDDSGEDADVRNSALELSVALRMRIIP